MISLLQQLKKHWGFDSLRPLQQLAVEAIMQKKDAMVLLPTGGGKSLCYQLPAVSLPGMALVVSPLISLMQDQVAQLTQRKVKSLHLSGNLSMRELDVLLNNAAYGDYKLIYLSPERLQADWILERLQGMNISFIAVDEAHCISQWGYDFRPSYLNITKLRELMPELPVMALTATATNQVLEDISREIRLRDPVMVRDSFFRKNLSLYLLESERKEARAFALLKQTSGTAIIYLRSRKGTVELSKHLNDAGISASFYHAGMEPEERKKVQEQWMRGSIRVVVATNAFGMGIDKPDVRQVFHLDIPDSPENYYQEIGRAGRDGQSSSCYLLYNAADVLKLQESWKDEPDIQTIRKIYTTFFSSNQIATGAGQYQEVPLHIHSFSSKFGFSSRHVHQAFTLLDRAGLVKYEDVSARPSSFVFTLPSDQLYRFQVQNPSMEPIVKALLRLYGGITENYTEISEELISKKTGIPIPKVIKQLDILTLRAIARYRKRYKGTTVVLLTVRLPESHISIQHELLKRRVDNKKTRAEAMVSLIRNEEKCRMLQLVNYFNERIETNCGRCDVCIGDYSQEIKNVIYQHASQEGLSLQQVALLMPQVTKEKLKEAIEQLLDEEKIIRLPNGRLLRS